MARSYQIEEASNDLKKQLARCFQSAHINFLIGSGASRPAIAIAGTLEREIAELAEAGNDAEARQRMYGFMAGIQGPMNRLIDQSPDDANAETNEYYTRLLHTIETILTERRTSLLPKQATIFTTNYDLFVESAAISNPGLNVNDGFSRVPSLDNRMEYSSRSFFNTTYNTGNVYDYKVEIPSINLVKLHGSLSWKKREDEILFEILRQEILPEDADDDALQGFIDRYAVILPQTSKFRTTLMDRTYYELLRIYANQLDRENALLVSFGFSFSDEHILAITKRALKNPTLKLIAFAFKDEDRISLGDIFEGFNNVDILAPIDEETLGFSEFNAILGSFLPALGRAA